MSDTGVPERRELSDSASGVWDADQNGPLARRRSEQVNRERRKMSDRGQSKRRKMSDTAFRGVSLLFQPVSDRKPDRNASAGSARPGEVDSLPPSSAQDVR